MGKFKQGMESRVEKNMYLITDDMENVSNLVREGNWDEALTILEGATRGLVATREFLAVLSVIDDEEVMPHVVSEWDDEQ